MGGEGGRDSEGGSEGGFEGVQEEEGVGGGGSKGEKEGCPFVWLKGFRGISRVSLQKCPCFATFISKLRSVLHSHTATPTTRR